MTPGFADPVADAQACFRALLDAMSRPGRVQSVRGIAAPAPLGDAAAAALLTLVDHETPLWLDPEAEAARQWIAFHTGATVVGSPNDGAAFAMALSLPPMDALPTGSDEAPETSITVILQVASLTDGSAYVLSGPGLREPAMLRVAGLPNDFVSSWQRNRDSFPRGIDLILCAGNRLTALPRSVCVRES